MGRILKEGSMDLTERVARKMLECARRVSVDLEAWDDTSPQMQEEWLTWAGELLAELRDKP